MDTCTISSWVSFVTLEDAPTAVTATMLSVGTVGEHWMQVQWNYTGIANGVLRAATVLFREGFTERTHSTVRNK